MTKAFHIDGALQILGGVYSFFGAERMSKEQAAAIERQQKAAAEGALEGFIADLTTLNRRDNEVQRQAAEIFRNLRREGAQASGQVTAASASGGVEGASTEALRRDFEFQSLARLEVARNNLDTTRSEIQDQREASSARATNIIQRTLGQRVARPDIFGALFNLGTDLFSSYLNNSRIDEGGNRRLNEL